MDPGMNDLLKWSVDNSQAVTNEQSSTSNSNAARSLSHPLNEKALNSLFGGPSDADLMKESLAAILSLEITLENKIIAFDNFEQLIEQIDNANNMDNLGLWPPIASLLGSKEADLRRYACWCIGTAVQNNVKCQERLVAEQGTVGTLVKLAIDDSAESVRRKAIYALSSGVRNYQPALDEAVQRLPKNIVPEGGTDASNMDAVDQIMQKLREDSARKAAA
ncbi:uncharacterized protein KY384_003775 [Bacidia gigantensis]|uniref:uncharacterized protein n=1 Tax=Bacidia gigantensis TaxID=2732470 RepID=UPI001D0539AE|nr:uncharacterized protein KY384_003775 [Bacidia gigantensis]KAG8532136.1 hypothetical protein KY384_003775 [Bacidia gigantensis]